MGGEKGRREGSENGERRIGDGSSETGETAKGRGQKNGAGVGSRPAEIERWNYAFGAGATAAGAPAAVWAAAFACAALAASARFLS
jgi:hypothetical protein